MKKILSIIIILAGLIIGFFGIPSLVGSSFNDIAAKLQNGDEAALTNQLTEIAEASVLEYDYTNALLLKDDDKIFKKISIPFSKKEVVMIYDGVLKLGADFSDMKVTVAGDSGDTKDITITLPEISINSNEIDRDSVTFPVEKNSIINKLTNKDYEQLEERADKEVKNTVKSNGTMDRAKAELKDTLKGYLEGLYDGKVNVQFN